MPKVGIPVRRPLRYKRWEIKGEWLHPQRDPQPSHGTATKSGRSRADQLVRKYLSRTRCCMVQTAEHAELRRGSGSRDYDYHKALGGCLAYDSQNPMQQLHPKHLWLLGSRPSTPSSPCGPLFHSAYHTQNALPCFRLRLRTGKGRGACTVCCGSNLLPCRTLKRRNGCIRMICFSGIIIDF